MKILKFLVIFMGILIVFALGMVITLMLNRSSVSHPSLTIKLPVSTAKIEKCIPNNEHIYCNIVGAQGLEKILVFSQKNGKLEKEINIVHQ